MIEFYELKFNVAPVVNSNNYILKWHSQSLSCVQIKSAFKMQLLFKTSYSAAQRSLDFRNVLSFFQNQETAILFPGLIHLLLA